MKILYIVYTLKYQWRITSYSHYVSTTKSFVLQNIITYNSELKESFACKYLYIKIKCIFTLLDILNFCFYTCSKNNKHLNWVLFKIIFKCDDLWNFSTQYYNNTYLPSKLYCKTTFFSNFLWLYFFYIILMKKVR